MPIEIKTGVGYYKKSDGNYQPISGFSPESGGDIIQDPTDPKGGLVSGATLAEVDKTLTLQDAAAESKTTGDAIRSLQVNVDSAVNKADNIESDLYTYETFTSVGMIFDRASTEYELTFVDPRTSPITRYIWKGGERATLKIVGNALFTNDVTVSFKNSGGALNEIGKLPVGKTEAVFENVSPASDANGVIIADKFYSGTITVHTEIVKPVSNIESVIEIDTGNAYTNGSMNEKGVKRNGTKWNMHRIDVSNYNAGTKFTIKTKTLNYDGASTTIWAFKATDSVSDEAITVSEYLTPTKVEEVTFETIKPQDGNWLFVLVSAAEYNAGYRPSLTAGQPLNRKVQLLEETLSDVSTALTEVENVAYNRSYSANAALIADNNVYDVVGIPQYLTAEMAQQYTGKTDAESGWYWFGWVHAPSGAKVEKKAFQFYGSKNAILGGQPNDGDDRIMVAIRFDALGSPVGFYVKWNSTMQRSDSFMFRCDDLAIRNLDYKTTYYVYNLEPYTVVTDEKVTFEGMTQNVTYQYKVRLDKPVEIILPQVDEEEGHGVWMELQLYFTGAFSLTLVPPEGVAVKNAPTPTISAGYNVIDLMYYNIDGVKCWRVQNTRSTF